MSVFIYRKQTRILRSADDVYAWHAAGGALQKLIPPWQKVTVVMHEGLAEGSLAVLRLEFGPFRILWQALHKDIIPGRQFRDQQLAGPFKAWTHTHRMLPDGPDACWLEDEVQCELPGGAAINRLLRPLLRRNLERLFAYRHQATLKALSHPTTPLERAA